MGIFLHSYRNCPLDAWRFSTIRHYHICDRSGRLGDRVGCTLRFQTDPLPNTLSVDMPRTCQRDSLLIPSPFPTVQTCTVVSRTCPKIESVRSPLWEKTGRPAGNLQCLCPKIRLRAWTRMHRKRFTIEYMGRIPDYRSRPVAAWRVS